MVRGKRKNFSRKEKTYFLKLSFFHISSLKGNVKTLIKKDYKRIMILVTKSERKALDDAGVLTYRRRLKNGGWEDANFTVVNRQHNSRDKSTYVVETPEILAFLGRYDDMNLQVIRPEQLQILREKGLIHDKDVQHVGEYNPDATVFIDREGKIRCKKVTSYMFELKIWRK